MRIPLLLLTWTMLIGAAAQTGTPVMDATIPQEYEIGGITVSGTVTTDPNAVKLFTGLQVGDKVTVPGERISKAIENLWDQNLFGDISIEAAEIRGRTIFLHIIVEEKPRLGGTKYPGLSRSVTDKLSDIVPLRSGQQLSESVLAETKAAIRSYFTDKGYLKANVTFTEVADTAKGYPRVNLYINVDKGPKVKIKSVDRKSVV